MQGTRKYRGPACHAGARCLYRGLHSGHDIQCRLIHTRLAAGPVIVRCAWQRMKTGTGNPDSVPRPSMPGFMGDTEPVGRALDVLGASLGAAHCRGLAPCCVVIIYCPPCPCAKPFFSLARVLLSYYHLAPTLQGPALSILIDGVSVARHSLRRRGVLSLPCTANPSTR